MDKIRVAVLRGGPSEEYGVSMRTGESVLRAIDLNTFQPLDVVITKSGEWLYEGFIRYPEHVLDTVDVVLLALHGTYGEDGKVQRLLERYGVKYTGSGPLASAVAMHKATAKNKVKALGVSTPKHMLVTRDAIDAIHGIATAVAETFGPEYIIKPVSSGSSLGTKLVGNTAILGREILNSLEEYPEVLVEERIRGREVTCGIIERFRDEALYALPPTEIIPPPRAAFFDATVNYSGEAEEICPARFDMNTISKIETIAKQIHEGLGLSQLSRSDFIVADDDVYFLEVNTLPGLTNQSIFPKAVEAVGSSFTDFITHLLTDALDRPVRS